MDTTQHICNLCLQSRDNPGIVNDVLLKAVSEIFNFTKSNNSLNICISCSKTVIEFYSFYCSVKENLQNFNEFADIKKETEEDYDNSISSPTYFACNDDTIKTESETETVKVEVNVVFPEKLYECEICKGTFKTYTYIKRHILRKHLGLSDISCYICKKNLYDTSSLKRHIDAVHHNIKSKSRRKECPHCKLTVSNLYSHMNYKHAEYQNPKSLKFLQKETFYCDLCNATFVRKNYLKRHILQKHLNIFEDKCPICDKGFYDQTAVKRHIKEFHEHKKNPPKRSVCVECGKYVTAIQLHMRRVHNKERGEMPPKKELPKIECVICKKMMSSRQDNINEHMRRVHHMDIPKKEKRRKIKV